jgi:hypothetical protein
MDMLDLMKMKPSMLRELQVHGHEYDSVLHWLGDLAQYHGKIRVVRALRLLFDMGLVEAKHMAEHLFENDRFFDTYASDRSDRLFKSLLTEHERLVNRKEETYDE